MTLYNKQDLYNRYVREGAEDAYNNSSIDQSSYINILSTYPDQLYTPNIFIRLALGFLTFIAVLFLSVIVFLATEGLSGVALLFIGIICYVALSLFTQQKKYFNAGIDNVLILLVIAFITAAAVLDHGYKYAGNELFFTSIFLVSLFLAVRFIDAFAALLSCASFIILSYLLFIKIGVYARYAAPFFIGTICAVMYALASRYEYSKSMLYYRSVFVKIRGFCLLAFFASFNYFIVNEVSNLVFDRNKSDNQFSLGWFFWLPTVMIPVAYLTYGVKKKKLLFIRAGIVLIAASICTIRYYHSFMPVEIAMLVSGSIIMIFSYYLLRYLKVERHGYIATAISNFHRNTDISILIAQQVIISHHSQNPIPDSHNKLFDGGSGGGGGAGGEF